jgi:hypothetical protein
VLRALRELARSRGFTLTAALALAVAASRTFAGLLFGVSATNAPTYAAAIVTVCLVSLGGAYISTRRP